MVPFLPMKKQRLSQVKQFGQIAWVARMELTFEPKSDDPHNAPSTI